MNNYNISLSNNQEKIKEYENIILWMKNLLFESTDYSPLSVGKRFTENSRQILSVMIRYCSLFQTTYISHERIAQLTGVHHDTVLRTLHLFARLGIIKITNRGVKQTCLYELGSFFHNDSVQWQLKDILPNLYWGMQHIIRRCKATIKVILGHWEIARKYNTAQLLNNKIKRDIYIKTMYKKTAKPEPKVQELETVEENRVWHNKNFNEFAAILGIEPIESEEK